MYRNTTCKLQAHRGVCTEAPENTMAAFRLAVAQGYDIIEFDPKMTRDNVCIILHDRTLNRTGRVAGEAFADEVKIADLTFADLAPIDVGGWFAPQYIGEHIPTLAQALDYMKSVGIGRILSASFRSSLWSAVLPSRMQWASLRVWPTAACVPLPADLPASTPCAAQNR